MLPCCSEEVYSAGIGTIVGSQGLGQDHGIWWLCRYLRRCQEWSVVVCGGHRSVTLRGRGTSMREESVVDSASGWRYTRDGSDVRFSCVLRQGLRSTGRSICRPP